MKSDLIKITVNVEEGDFVSFRAIAEESGDKASNRLRNLIARDVANEEVTEYAIAVLGLVKDIKANGKKLDTAGYRQDFEKLNLSEGRKQAILDELERAVSVKSMEYGMIMEIIDRSEHLGLPSREAYKPVVLRTLAGIGLEYGNVLVKGARVMSVNKRFKEIRGSKGLDFDSYLYRLIHNMTAEEKSRFKDGFNYTELNKKYAEELLSDYTRFCEEEGVEKLNIGIREGQDYGEEVYFDLDGYDVDEEDTSYVFILESGKYQSEEIEIPEFINYTEEDLFMGNNVKRIKVTGGNTAFHSEAFTNNQYLEEVVFEGGAGFFNASFAGCTNLKKVNMCRDAEFTEIIDGDGGTFDGCDSLEELSIYVSNLDNVDLDVFKELLSLRKFELKVDKKESNPGDFERIFRI